MTAEIFCLPKGSLSAKQVLEQALKEEFNEVIVVGIRKELGEDGEKLWVSASTPFAERTIWLLNSSAFWLSKALSESEL